MKAKERPLSVFRWYRRSTSKRRVLPSISLSVLLYCMTMLGSVEISANSVSPAQLAAPYDEVWVVYGELLEGYELVDAFEREEFISKEFDHSGSLTLMLPEGISVEVQITKWGSSGNRGVGYVDGNPFNGFQFSRYPHVEVLDLSLPGVGEFRYLGTNATPTYYLVGRHLGDENTTQVSAGEIGLEEAYIPTSSNAGWRYNHDLGWFYGYEGGLWYYQLEHGWFHAATGMEHWDTLGIWLYFPMIGWAWGGGPTHPWLWINAEGIWRHTGTVRMDPTLYGPIPSD